MKSGLLLFRGDGFRLSEPVDGIPEPPADTAPPLDQFQFTTGHSKSEEGVVYFTSYVAGEKPAFGFKRMAEKPLQKACLDDFAILAGGGDRSAPVKVLLHEAVFLDLDKKRSFSNKVEEGGFLVGRVYEDGDVPNTQLVELTAALGAEHTGASLFHFTYTVDSFVAFKNILRRYFPKQRMLGWYHTHLSPANTEMGDLSSSDLELHFTTFRQPWQLAGLINLDAPGKRTLRFYVRQNSLMVPCPQWIIQ
ncbi:MAG: hypothetical protein GY862_12470 [Gammaproteobacteria bacterium]|nr:hypothetical protein [Gammaproteobacteria bacterium]